MRARLATLLVAASLVAAGTTCASAQGNPHGLVRAPGAYFITIGSGASHGAIGALVRDAGGTVDHEYTLTPDRIHVAGLSDEGARGLTHARGVLDVAPDYVASAFLVESVSLINAAQTQIQAAGIDADGSGQVVCILDTGINPDHLMFSAPAAKIVAWADFVNGAPAPYDDNGHGSHVAGIVAGRTGLTLGSEPFHGVAPGAALAIGKVLDAAGSGTFGGVQAGIDWCVGIGARTISMSLGGGLFDAACDGAADPTGTADHVNAAAAAGALVVSAAGNDRARNAVSTPACASGSMAVGATYDANLGRISFSGCTDRKTGVDRICCFSNRGALLDVVAPGCLITSADAGSPSLVVGYCGTSQAAPHVAGLGALLWQLDPAAAVGTIRSRITATAIDLGSAGFDTTYGYGRIDALAALEATLAVCGNGVAEPGEACDAGDLGGHTCQQQGFDGGALACTAACQLDTSACTTAPGCTPVSRGRCNCDGSCSGKERSYVASGGACSDCP